MKNDYDLDDLLSDDPMDDVKWDMDIIKSNVPQYSNEKLCEMIVCDRYFGFGQEISSICMEELSKRRMNGDNFDFESYIDKVGKELPDLNFGNMDIGSTLKKMIGKK